MKKLMIIGLTVLALTSCNKVEDYSCDCKVSYDDGTDYSISYPVSSKTLDYAGTQCSSKAQKLLSDFKDLGATTVDWKVQKK
jgi:hypothetical protein